MPQDPPTAPHVAGWEPLGSRPPEDLSATRLILHQAVQLLASFGQTLLEPRADDSHRSMTWDMSRRAFRSEVSADGLQVLVVVPDFTVEVRRQNELVAAMDLNGATVETARRWLGATLGEARGAGPLTMAWPEYDVPEPPAGAAAPLQPDGPALEELARWYHDAALVLETLFAGRPEASPLLCWPHHFDLATLLTYPPTAEGGEACSVGVGLSPGDESLDQPYVYVNGWPPPDPKVLPERSGPGRWHTEGWVGAVLPADEVVAERRPAEQAARVAAFATEAGAVMREVVLEVRAGR